PALRQQRVAKIPVRLGGYRIEIRSPPELAGRVFFAARGCERNTEIVVHVGRRGLTCDGTLEMIDRTRRVAFVKKQVREIVMSRRELRLQLERLLVIRQ